MVPCVQKESKLNRAKFSRSALTYSLHHVIENTCQLYCQVVCSRTIKLSCMLWSFSSTGMVSRCKTCFSASETPIIHDYTFASYFEPSHSWCTQTHQTSSENSCLARIVSKERSVLQSVHRQTEEAKLGRAQSSKSEVEHWKSYHRLHSRRGSQLARAQCRACTRGSNSGSARCKVSVER